VRALNAFINLMRAADSLTTRLHAPLAAAGLTVGQFGVLEALYHVGPLRQNELARKVLCTPGNLSIVLDNLERRKLVRRESDPDDRRCTRACLSDRGRRLIAEVLPGHVRRVQEAFSVLTPGEQESLRGLCRRVGLGGESRE
jgi:MarR family 2-MHQ and catechol resistance regulon transcriptional repressor